VDSLVKAYFRASSDLGATPGINRLCLINDGEIHFILVWSIFQNTRKIHIAQFNRPINI